MQPTRQPPIPPRENRLLLLSVVSLVLALAEIGWFGYKLLGALIAGALDYAQHELLPGAVPPEMAAAIAKVTATVRRLAALEVASLLPCAAMALALLVIAIGLLAARVSWLRAARVWCWIAFGALAVSLAVQVFVIAPELAQIERWVNTHLTGAGARSSVALPTLRPMIAHALLLGVWPFVLWFWAGYLKNAEHPLS